MKQKTINQPFNLKRFAADILEKRIKDNLSFTALSELIGIPRSSLHKYEAATATPDISQIVAVCNWLGVQVQVYLTSKTK